MDPSNSESQWRMTCGQKSPSKHTHKSATEERENSQTHARPRSAVNIQPNRNQCARGASDRNIGRNNTRNDHPTNLAEGPKRSKEEEEGMRVKDTDVGDGISINTPGERQRKIPSLYSSQDND